MKKKTLLSVGAIALALGLGVTAMNAAGVLSLPFSAVVTADEATGTLVYKGALPANESILPNWQSISSCQFEFTDANPGTFPGVVVNRDCGTKIKVQRSTTGTFYDDSTIWEIDPADENAVFVDSKYPGRVTVRFPEELSIYGSSATKFTYYKVIMPAGVVSKDANGSEMDPDNPGVVTSASNAEVSVNYTVKRTPQYATSPRSGQTVSTMNGGLLEASISYSTGVTKIEMDGDKKATLYYCDPSGANASAAGDAVGTYTLSVDGTTVKLTLDGGEQPALNANRCYYKIVVPADSFTPKDGDFDFFASANSEIVIDNISLVWLDASVVEFVDEDDEPAARTYASTTDFPRVFYTVFPGKIAMAGTNLTTGAGLYPVGSTLAVAQYNGEILPNGTTIEWTMKDPTSATSKVGRPEWWSAGKYEFDIAVNKVSDPATGQKNPKLIFSGIEFETGLDVDPVVAKNLNTGSNWRDKNESGAVVSLLQDAVVKEDQFGAVPSDPGVSCARFQFLTGVKPDVNNTTASITLTKKGSATPLVEIHPEATVNKPDGHLWYGTGGPSSAASTENKAVSAMSVQSSWEVWYKLTEQKAYFTNSISATSTGYYIPEMITAGGTYVLHADKGFFVDAAGVPSAEINYEFTIVGEIESTVAPESGATLDALDAVTITYPEDCTVSVPEGTTVQLLDNYSEPKNSNYQLPVFNVTAKGNVVTLAPAEPFQVPNRYNYQLKVPGALWTITQGGESNPNTPYELKYTIASVGMGTVKPATDAAVRGTELASILYTSPINIAAIGTAGATLYKVEGEERTAVASYTAALATDSEGDVIVAPSVTWTTTDNVADLAAGTYEFEIPAGAITVKGYNSNVASDKAFVYTYDVLAPLPKFADSFKLSDPAATTFYTWPGGNNAYVIFEATDANAKLEVADTNAEFQLLRDGEVIATWKGSSEVVAYEEPFMGLGAVLELDLYKLPNFAELDINAAGVYTIVVPEGYLTLDGEALRGASYEFTKEVKPVDFTYTLDPAAGSEVETLESIILNFPNATDVKYVSDSEHPIATLVNEDGTVKVDCVYAKTDFVNTITLQFGDSNTEWVSGKYTLTVNPGIINLDDANWDDSDVNLGKGNFEGLTAEYTLNYTASKWGEISDYINLQLPATLEPNKNNTLSQLTPDGGMAILGFGLKTKDFKGVAGAEFIQYYYQADAASDPVLMKTVNPTNDQEIIVIGAGIMDEGDLLEFQPVNYLYINFAGDGDGGMDETLVAQYQRSGYYTVVIPDGAFEADGQLLRGIQLTYNYSSEVGEFSYPFTLDPASDTEVAVAEDVFGAKGTGITLTFEGAKWIDCKNKPATLTCPNGTVLTVVTPIGGMNKPYYTWKFPAAGYEWEPGKYTFTIEPGAIGVDMGWYDDDWTEGNFPGLTAVYEAKAGTLTGITMIGVEQADSYTVYTMDGKVVKLNAAADDMLDLEPGLYVINGKKAIVRK